MDPRSLTPALRVLRLCLHLLMAGLLALAVVRAVTGDTSHVTHATTAHTVAVCAAAVAMGAVYAAGSLLPRVRSSPRAAALWLAALWAVWAVLLWLTPDGLWAAFPLYFLQLHLLPVRWSLPAVGATAAAAIASYVGHSGGPNPGAFIGPLLGAAVAVATVLGYQALYRESERHRRLVRELMSTRAELAAAERHAGTLAERERLAREIHDTLAQGLSSIQLLLRAAERALPEGSPAAEHIDRARVAAQDNLAEARRFVRALSPPDLERGSLAGALERLCEPGPGPRVRFSASGEPVELPTPYEVALLRIAQSAVANAVRHADASRAEVTLSFMDSAVALDVVDDGRGFDPDAVAAPTSEGGFGLPAMRLRAQSLGGTFTVESAPGQGTAVAVTLPLPAGDPPGAPPAGAAQEPYGADLGGTR
ncbi:sensor histidine kinase [Streptomyces sp. NPDC001941]|uniref:sensor histidine kinase n=1 Tax=Streptomyces sp. NPDC001941 TaxID=3154659 RepID=UPI003334239C